MTKITFSGADQYPVDSYTSRLIPTLKGVSVVPRVNTWGEQEYVDTKQLTEVVKAKLPPNIKGKVQDSAIKERLQTSDPHDLTDIDQVVRSIADQFKQK